MTGVNFHQSPTTSYSVQYLIRVYVYCTYYCGDGTGAKEKQMVERENAGWPGQAWFT